MGNCWAGLACEYAEKQVGEVCGKSSKYAKELDAVDFYNTKKDGYANSCSLFVDDCVYNGCTDPTPEEDPEGAKWTALYMLNEPQSEGANEGAGCAQAVRYFQEMGAWYEDNFERGDKYFLRRDSAVSANNPLGVYHTGMIVGWGYYDELGAEGYKCVEGNTTYEGESGMVGVKYYKFGDKRIAGAGRPRYDGWLPEDSGSDDTDTDPEPTPEPTPAPAPEPKGEKYIVTNVSSWLNVRNGCGKEYPVVDKLYNGEKVKLYETKDGWARISNDMDLWVSMDYLTKA